ALLRDCPSVSVECDFQLSSCQNDLDGGTFGQFEPLSMQRSSHGSARSRSTRHCLACTTLPHAHFQHVIADHSHKLNICTFRKVHVVFNHWPETTHECLRRKRSTFSAAQERLLHRDHKVRVPHRDRPSLHRVQLGVASRVHIEAEAF